MKKVGAVFLDRDGVVIWDAGHLHKKSQVKLLPGIEELAKLGGKGFILLFVSNQSAVARGLLTEEELWEIDEFVRRLLAPKGVVIKKSYYCPHYPEITGSCFCRKPKPGLLLKAIKELAIDPKKSAVIGDKISDLEAGRKAGVKFGILVKINGEYWDGKKGDLANVKYKTDNLAEAVKLVLKKLK